MSTRPRPLAPRSVLAVAAMLPWALSMLVAPTAAQTAEPSCEQRSERAMEDGIRISSRTNLFRVASERELLLYTAPDAACSPLQPMALMPGMEVVAYVLHRGYTAVLWNPPGAAKPGVLWVRSSGLRPLGTGIAPR